MFSTGRRLVAVSGTLLLSVVSLAGYCAAAPGAIADTAPPSSSTPVTVSADALPTVQINGVVWSQATAGNTVYATGSFTSARPAGAAAGQSETSRRYLLAYDITTGKLITSFAHSLNAQGIVAATSPDGAILYVGGDFTSVDGHSRGHIAAFSTATGALLGAFTPSVNARVKAISATRTTVYVGGSFTTANGSNHARLAAFNATNGALLSFAPVIANNSVTALAMSPSGKTLVTGGSFDSVGGKAIRGLTGLDPITGAVKPFAANGKIHDSGTGGGITSLRSDGTSIIGTGYAFGSGNFEGAFAAEPDTGAIIWMEDCHGDSYDSFSAAKVTYVVSHAHYCGNIQGGFPDDTTDTWHRALAYTDYATGTIAHNTGKNPTRYTDWFGNPGATLLDWFPTLVAGTFTGQGQAAWSATGNAGYLALGGEFPTVNGVGQQGLVRFAVKSLAPNKVGPKSLASLSPKATSPSTGVAQVTWQTTWDMDNQALTYQVVRDANTATPVLRTTVLSSFWVRPSPVFQDKGLVSGSTHTYRIYVADPLGNRTNTTTVSVKIK